MIDKKKKADCFIGRKSDTKGRGNEVNPVTGCKECLKQPEVNTKQQARQQADPNGNSKETPPSMTGKMTVSHAKFQYYRHNYCLLCMTGLLGCRWHRYQQSTQDNRKRDTLWFAALIAVFLYTVFYFYFWLVAENDYNDLEWYVFGKLKKWIHCYRIMLALVCTAFSYFVLLMVLSLCHFGHGHQVYIHPIHLVLVFLSLAACIAITVIIDDMWHQEWKTIYYSFQIVGPFLHIGAVIILTPLTWLISFSWYKLSHKGLQLLWLLIFMALTVVLYTVPLYIHCPCLTASAPPKPHLFGHRGAEAIAPENTEISFQKAVMAGLYGLESDVRISYDGVPFLHHDNTLRRTTDVATKFPDRADHDSSMFNFSELQQLNAGSWFLEADPYGTAGSLSDNDRTLVAQQKIANLSWLLEFASKNDKALMFDVRSPPLGHPYAHTTVDLVIQTVMNSTFNVSKLYWLVDDSSQPAPPGAYLTLGLRSGGTVAGVFKQNLTSVNAPYFEVTEQLLQGMLDHNISTNVWVVDSPWFFSYFWCLGSTSVTTRRVDWLASMSQPVWTLSPGDYQILWIAVDVLSGVIIIIIFIAQRIRIFGASFSPESISLTAARKVCTDRSRNMKEKLLRDGIIDPLEDPEGQSAGVVNQPVAYSLSSLPTPPFEDGPGLPVGPITEQDRRYNVE